MVWFDGSSPSDFYVKDRVNLSELSTYEALTNSQWKNRVCIRSSNNIYNQSLVASMIQANGAEATQKWAEGLMSNLARKPAAVIQTNFAQQQRSM